METVGLVVGGLVVAAIVGWLVWRAYVTHRDTPDAVKEARKALKAAEKAKKDAIKPLERTLAQDRKKLSVLEDPKGKRLSKYAKVTLYELWVDTPSGSGELSPQVDAFVDDASSSRFTATRFLAVGVFALAFKKKTGKVFLSVDHPDFVHLSEVGPKEREKATKFAAEVKNAGRKADSMRKSRPIEAGKTRSRIAEYEAKVRDAKALHEQRIAAAEQSLSTAAAETGYDLG